MANIWLDATLMLLLAATLASFQRLPAHGSHANGPRADFAASPSVRALASTARRRHRRMTRQAGVDPDAIRWLYWTIKLTLAVVIPLLLLEVAGDDAIAVGLVASSAVVGLVVSDLWLLALRQRRRRRVRTSLSYFLDLLVALVHSGSSLEEAFARAGRGIGRGRSHPLADEVALIARELDLGKERDAAFRALAERTGVTELKALASALTMGIKLGSSVESVLASQADILRDRQRAEGLKQINRAAIQAILPTLLCGFPILLLLVLFPAVLEVIEAFQLLKTVLD